MRDVNSATRAFFSEVAQGVSAKRRSVTAEKCSSPTARRFQKHTFQVERATPSPALQAWGAHKMLPHVLNRASQRAWPLQAFVTVAGLRPPQTMTPNPFQGAQRARPARYSGARRRAMQGPSQAVYVGQIRGYLGHPSSRQRAARRIPVSPPLSDA